VNVTEIMFSIENGTPLQAAGLYFQCETALKAAVSNDGTEGALA
jgi:hypothetical protein